MEELPLSVVEWLLSEGVNPSHVGKEESHRHFRILGQVNQNKADEIIAQVSQDLNIDSTLIKRITWLPSSLWFYEIPINAPLAQCTAHQTGLIQVHKHIYI
jgi:hypothetical protein